MVKYKKRLEGSITVEAALVTPIFLFVVIAFLYFFQILLLQEQIQDSITKVSKLASQYGYVSNYLSEKAEQQNTEVEIESEGEDGEDSASKIVQGFVDGSMFKIKFMSYMGDDVNDNCIVGGLNGISFLESSFMRNEDYIEVVAIYIVKIPVPFLQTSPFTVVQRVKSRAFVGESLQEDGGGVLENSEGNTDDEYVYITKTGTVYHKDYNCTYLNVKISTVSGSNLSTKRNSSGAIYYPCESCMSGECQDSGTYYITEYGTRYHSSKSCNKLERDIQKIKLSEVGSRRACSKCGK